MKLLLFFASIIALSSAIDWHAWTSLHQVSVDENDLEYRQSVWNKNYELTKQHNSNPNKTFSLGLTNWAQLTNKEYRQHLSKPTIFKNPDNIDSKTPFAVPSAWDWRQKNMVGPVVNQGTFPAFFPFPLLPFFISFPPFSSFLVVSSWFLCIFF